jgi:hypothetical protein
MPPETREYKTAAAIGQNSYVSIGLVASLVLGAMFYGKQLQRLDSIEAKLTELSADVRELRKVVPSLQPGR